MDLKAYALLDKHVSVLGLSPELVRYLAELGVEDVSTLLDQEWTRYPESFVEAIRTAALAHGLVEESEPDFVTTPAAEQEWERVSFDDYEGGIQAYYLGEDNQPPDMELIGASEGYASLNSLTVDCWLLSLDGESDFRPWLDLLRTSPPPELESLYLGNETPCATLGTVAATVAVLPHLRELGLSGSFSSVMPFATEQLEFIELHTEEWASADMERFVAGTQFLRLKRFFASSQGSASPLGPLLALPAIEAIELWAFTLSADLFGSLESPSELVELNLAACRWPENDGTVVTALVRAAPCLQQTRIILPVDAKRVASTLEGAGLKCSFRAG